MENRRTTLVELCKSLDEGAQKVLEKVIDEVIFLEMRLDELKKLPQISTNPNNPAQQRATPAAKQYKEFLQQYNNCIKILLKAVGDNETEETSPLREGLIKLREKYQ